MAEYGEPLSQREIEVLELMATGATNRQIAHQLVVSVNTVKVHLRNIFSKLGVESRTEATLIAIREGLVNVSAAEVEVTAGAPEITAGPTSSERVTVDGRSAVITEPPLPPLPRPKRVALVAILLLVALVTVMTWPHSHTAAGRLSDDTDSLASESGGSGVAAESTGWRALAPMTTARSRFALVATVDGRLCAIGGETIGGISGAAECYDTVTDQWTALAGNKPTRVSNISAAPIGDWIYVPGGLTAEGKATTAMEGYDSADEAWTQLAPLPRPLSGYALVAYQGRLYLFGGKDERGYANSTLMYDPQQDRWSEGRTMPTQRAYAAAAALGSRIYVVGGYDGQRELPTCEAYRPLENLWEDCEPLTLARGGLGLAAVANQLYAVGGGWSNNLWFSEQYNPGTGTWKPFETPVSRQWRNLAVAATPVQLYVAGGWNGNYLNGVWEFVVLPYTIFIPAASP